MDRRGFVFALAAPLGVILALHTGVAAGSPDPQLRIRQRVRHRVRRRVAVRTVRGRPLLVVPTDLAVGWEMQHLNRVVVVRGFRFIDAGAGRSEVAVVQKGGISEEIPIVREDTYENTRNLAGGAIDTSDLSTPAIEDSPRQ